MGKSRPHCCPAARPDTSWRWGVRQGPGESGELMTWSLRRGVAMRV